MSQHSIDSSSSSMHVLDLPFDLHDDFPLSSQVFRTYDLRGHGEEQLSSQFCFALGYIFAQEVRSRFGSVGSSSKPIAIGRDCRLSGERIFQALQWGLRCGGVDVLDLGEVATPMVYFVLHTQECNGGIMITGSHNPKHWNGFKMSIGKESIYGSRIQELYQTLCKVKQSSLLSTLKVQNKEILGQFINFNPLSSYLEWMKSHFQLDDSSIQTPLKVVIDGGNGMGGPLAKALYTQLGCKVIELYTEPNGHFPNHHPDPTVESNLEELKDTVVQQKAHLGLAFDGDGDRIGVVDELGRVLWGDQLLLFFAEQILQDHPDALFLGEVKCSEILYQGVRKKGGRIEMGAVGHSLIKAKMKEIGACLAGEMSGHLFFADRFFGYDDAVYVGARLIEILINSKISLAEWVDTLPTSYTTPELRVVCEDQDKTKVIQRVFEAFKDRYEVNQTDGVRLSFEHGWGLIRASNTQPVLVMRFEASTQDLLEHYRNEIETWLTHHAPEVNLTDAGHHA